MAGIGALSRLDGTCQGDHIDRLGGLHMGKQIFKVPSPFTEFVGGHYSEKLNFCRKQVHPPGAEPADENISTIHHSQPVGEGHTCKIDCC